MTGGTPRKGQKQLLIEASRAHGATEDETVFDKVLRQIASQQNVKKAKVKRKT